MHANLLSKLTIIIFSYNRHECLKRTIKYWLSYNVKLVVLDGSDVKLQDPCLHENNIKYVHDPRGLYERLLSSIDYIETEFMMLGCDDEFYLTSALSSCIEFLLKEPTYSSCGGRAVGFHTMGKKIFGSEMYPTLKDLSLDQDTPFERTKKHFCNYEVAHLYSVNRSSNWKIICKYVFEKEYNFFAALELQIEFLVLVAGKSKIIPKVMWLRNQEEPPIRGTSPSVSYAARMPKWWHHKTYKEEKKDFLNRMQTACDDLLKDNASKINQDEISNVYELFVNKSLENNLFQKFFFRKLIDLTPHIIREIIKTFLIWYKFRTRNYKSLIDEVGLLESQGVSVNYNELNKIISILSKVE